MDGEGKGADMKERPLLFSSAMVHAILEGRKTQTRRIVKLTDSGRVKGVGSPKNWHIDDHDVVNACPYGIPGDRLWVKETFAHWSPKIIKYRADGECSDGDRREHYTPGKWRPSIFMPRWASRILLEITNVRVELLQDITEDGALAEGIEKLTGQFDGCYAAGQSLSGTTARECFQRLWNYINAANGFGWEANPWVWVVEFKKIKP